MSLDTEIDVLTWNLKRAGWNKSQNEETMEIIFDVLTGGSKINDIMVLQEIVSPSFIELLEKRFHDAKLPYRFLVIDAHYNNEFYAVGYNFKTVIRKPHIWQYPIEHNHIKRPPLVAYFHELDLAIVNVHTKPKYALDETRNLERVAGAAMAHFKTENVLIAGDLNCKPPYWEKPKRNPARMKDPVDFPGPYADTTTAKGTFEPYDHFIIDAKSRIKIVDGAVLNFNLGLEERLKGWIWPEGYRDQMMYISDHWPVWIRLAVPSPGTQGIDYGLFHAQSSVKRIFNGVKLYPVK